MSTGRKPLLQAGAGANLWISRPLLCGPVLWKICAFAAGIERIARLSDKYHIAAVNLEASDHAMPLDPLEIELALRAARVAWCGFTSLRPGELVAEASGPNCRCRSVVSSG